MTRRARLRPEQGRDLCQSAAEEKEQRSNTAQSDALIPCVVHSCWFALNAQVPVDHTARQVAHSNAGAP